VVRIQQKPGCRRQPGFLSLMDPFGGGADWTPPTRPLVSIVPHGWQLCQGGNFPAPGDPGPLYAARIRGETRRRLAGSGMRSDGSGPVCPRLRPLAVVTPRFPRPDGRGTEGGGGSPRHAPRPPTKQPPCGGAAERKSAAEPRPRPPPERSPGGKRAAGGGPAARAQRAKHVRALQPRAASKGDQSEAAGARRRAESGCLRPCAEGQRPPDHRRRAGAPGCGGGRGPRPGGRRAPGGPTTKGGPEWRIRGAGEARDERRPRAA
jgi:hypothetical protein